MKNILGSFFYSYRVFSIKCLSRNRILARTGAVGSQRNIAIHRHLDGTKIIPANEVGFVPVGISRTNFLKLMPSIHVLHQFFNESGLCHNTFSKCPWCNGYRRRKWTLRHEFKSWTRLIAFHIALIPLGKVLIQLFSLQLWVNSRTDWVLQRWWGNKSRRRTTLNSNLLNSA